MEELRPEFELYIKHARSCLSLERQDDKYVDEETQRLWETYLVTNS